jgi:hypothetical protein
MASRPNIPLFPSTTRKRLGKVQAALIPAVAAAPAPLFNLTDAGWVRPDPKGWAHWAEVALKGYVCGKNPSETEGDGNLLTVLELDERASLNAPCRDCISALVQRRYQTPFKIGDTVVSRAERMVLYGKVRSMFELDGEAWLNLDRIWLKIPQGRLPRGCWDVYVEPDLGTSDWYRAASTCRHWTSPKK